MLLCACTGHPTNAVPPHTVPAPTAVILTSVPAQDAITKLLIDERHAIVANDLTTLATLWTEDGSITDGRGTSIPDDDYTWYGKPAILDRYVVAVFVNPPPLLREEDIAVHNLAIDQARNTATLRTDADSWVFKRHNQRWRMHHLTYEVPIETEPK